MPIWVFFLRYPTVFAEGREGALLPLVPLADLIAQDLIRRTCQRWELLAGKVVCAGGWRYTPAAQVLSSDGR